MAGLKDWIGQNIGVKYSHPDGNIGQFIATLDDTNEMGITISYVSKEQEMRRFYPWHVIWHVHRMPEAPSQDKEDEKRKAGF